MTNKIEISRELANLLYGDTVERWGLGGNAAGQLRALLAADPYECLDGGKCGNGGYCDACPHTKEEAPAVERQDDAQTLVAQHQAFISGELEDLIDRASDFQDKAYALGLARGRLQAACINKFKELNQ